jgi:predicted NAD/FAD-binding protein
LGVVHRSGHFLSLVPTHAIRNFNSTKTARAQVLKNDAFKGVTLGQYLKRGWYSKVFCSKYLLPMCAAIWSVPTASVLDFPVQVRPTLAG